MIVQPRVSLHPSFHYLVRSQTQETPKKREFLPRSAPLIDRVGLGERAHLVHGAHAVRARAQPRDAHYPSQFEDGSAPSWSRAARALRRASSRWASVGVEAGDVPGSVCTAPGCGEGARGRGSAPPPFSSGAGLAGVGASAGCSALRSSPSRCVRADVTQSRSARGSCGVVRWGGSWRGDTPLTLGAASGRRNCVFESGQSS
jgi:hypothetical protein